MVKVLVFLTTFENRRILALVPFRSQRLELRPAKEPKALAE